MMDAQIDLFGSCDGIQDPVGSVDPAPTHVAVAAELPPSLRFGTSSWSFPGWRGLVYGRSVPEPTLAQYGLMSYSKHPLIRAVGIDRTYYAPLPEADFRRLAGQVPEDFRFLVKAHAALTTSDDANPTASDRTGVAELFLNADYATERVINPTVLGLGQRLGTILFQFPPLGVIHTRDPERFAAQLGAFLERLPQGPAYAVEIRNRELLSRAYSVALTRAGASHCFNVHPQMPDVLTQADILGEEVWQGRSVPIRWMLHPNLTYEDARRRYFPFDRVVDPDLRSRIAIVELITRVLATGRDVCVIANNKAEGSAPLTIAKLAEECVRRWRGTLTAEDPL